MSILGKLVAALATTPQPTPSAEDMQDILLWLCRYGKPRLGVYSTSGTWSCSVDIHVVHSGASLEIRSEYLKHTTPMAAVLECRDRVNEALRTLGANK